MICSAYFCCRFSLISYGKVITTVQSKEKGYRPWSIACNFKTSTYFLSLCASVCALLSQMSSKLWECVLLLLNDLLSSSAFSKIGYFTCHTSSLALLLLTLCIPYKQKCIALIINPLQYLS